MINKEILSITEALSNEKSLPKEIIFKTIEKALTIAIKKKYEYKINIKININRNNGKFYTYRRWMVVKKVKQPNKEISLDKINDKNIKIGDFIEKKIKLINFDRITTQTAKNIISKKIREAKKIIFLKKIIKKKGNIITGFIKKIKKKYLTIDIGYSVKAKILKKDMILKDKFKIGNKIKGILYKIKKKKNNYQILLTRSKIKMLTELFKKKIPEIKKNIIKIKSISRDPGSRSKIAVKTNNKRIDPIGACIGIKGSRVQSISNELSGEKIDIILWKKNIKKFVINAMSPAEISNILVNKKKKTINIKVETKNLAKAIGKNGQNIKLASQLIGWKINIITKKNKILNKNKI